MGLVDEMMPNDNLPAVANDDAMVIPRVRYKKTQTIDPSTIRPNFLRLAQGLTKEVADGDAKMGDFLVEGYAPVQSLDIVPFAAQKIRTYKPDRNAPPQCQAPDGDYGYGDPGGECAKCPLSHWGPRDPKTGKGTPPPCAEAIMVRAYSLTHQCLLDISFRNKEQRSGSFIAQQALTRGFGNFAVRLTSTMTNNTQGRWSIPVVTMLNGIPEEAQEWVGKWFAVHEMMIDQESGGDEAPF